ncbi:hypothetical protein FY034_00490 [Trichlorobacter lovleyi]|uniref:DUF6161 domain-containing protein n=1 Tax=Trichlorobacter lovleyi TaxID=313985 RepID=UPI00223F63D6|nr:DUF6161 domain-containing protein [Trichlorobacter lovleyi]QOX77480.1 hypothetical protein FY034_00490 [Trichlorobacter lovleyi]
MSSLLSEVGFDITIVDAAGEARQFTSVKSFRAMLEKESPFWDEAAKNSSNNEHIVSIRNTFTGASRLLDTFENGYTKWDENNRKIQLKSLTSDLVQRLKSGVFSDSPFAEALLNAVRIGSVQAQSFWNYVTNYNRGHLQNTNLSIQVLEGAILGYEYLLQDESMITKRRDVEKRALASMRRTLSDKTDEIVKETELLQQNLQTDSEEFKNELLEWKASIQEELSQQRDDFFLNAKTKLFDLEKLYTEKLKLEKPAEYWRERARQCRNAGRGWGAALITTTFGAIIVFAWLFSEWLQSGKVIEKFSAQHWQGIILLASVLSLSAFLIRTFGKLTFSAFHLQRDAEEREQLAYVYLALANETEFTDESRRIIFQALFSRTETGLLSGDHGPTMPGVTEVISKFK